MIAPARRAAHRVLRAVHTGRSDLANALERARRELADPRDRALTGEIATGVLRRRAALDHVVGQIASRPPTAMTPAVLDLLRAAAYQVLHLDRVPPHAAVQDAVALAREVGPPQAAGFVNAVLRGLVDERRPVTLPDRPSCSGDDRSATRRDAALDYLSITLSHPRWLVERWLDRHGLTAAAAWAQFNNRPAPVTLRPNRSRTSAAGLRAALDAAGVRTTPTRLAPHGLVVTAGDPSSTPCARGGSFLVQDEGSQLILELVDPPDGGRVLDLCAAPGGKTAGVAPSVGTTGLVVAADLRPRRVALLARTLVRTGSPRVSVVRLDATAPLPFGAVFDRVLVDAPCSGLGVIRRDPDVRWKRTPRDLGEFARRQLAMLQRAAAAVRPGGRIVYATCSSEPEENEAVIARFRAGLPRFRPVVPERLVPGSVLDRDGFLRTLPFRDGVDAFFGAVLALEA